MTTYFRAIFQGGRVEVRSTKSRAYAFCWMGPAWPYIGWTSRRDLIPASATAFSPAEEIDEITYRSVLKAREVKAAGGEQAAKLATARRALRSGQRDQFWAGKRVVAVNLQIGGATPSQAADEVGVYGIGKEQLAEAVSYLVEAQKRQANAFKRIAKAMRDIAKLEAAQAA